MSIPGQSDEAKCSVGILSPGGVGGFLAAVLWKCGHAVTCIARSETADLMRKQGLRFESNAFGNFTAWPQAVTRLESEPPILFVTTKAPFLSEALGSIPASKVEHTAIIPLLNGVEHLQVMRAHAGPRLIAGMISIEAVKLGPCHVKHASPHARVELASDSDIPHDQLQSIARLLSSAGIETTVLKHESDVVWRKLVRLNAIAAVTAMSRLTVGAIRTDSNWRRMLESCVREGTRVANAEGVHMDAETVMKQIDSLPADLRTSLQRDIERKCPSELDAILGGVLRTGQRHGISCPTIQSIHARLSEQSV